MCSLQPVLDTQKNQIELWCNLVLDYIRHFQLTELSVAQDLTNPLFYNKAIDRMSVMIITGLVGFLR
jgi:ESCRT-II complex subunit VPS25